MTMNKERLLNVAKALRESPKPRAFKMADFHSCGTPHCAIGHYAARRDLQQFFQLSRKHWSPMVGVWGATHVPCEIWPHYEAHFGITHQQAGELFSYYGCGRAETAIAAAEYIERFVASA
jgi:hypothetical protein